MSKKITITLSEHDMILIRDALHEVAQEMDSWDYEDEDDEVKAKLSYEYESLYALYVKFANLVVNDDKVEPTSESLYALYVKFANLVKR